MGEGFLRAGICRGEASGEQGFSSFGENDGFLAPGQEGSVSYTIFANRTSPTIATSSSAVNYIDSDNTRVQTNIWSATIDNFKPLSAVAPLTPKRTNPKIALNWSGSDLGVSSLVRDYSIYCSVDCGEFFPWLVNTKLKTGTFPGQGGSTYSIATNLTGNVELNPVTPDATTLVKLAPYLLSFSPNPVAGSKTATGTVTINKPAPAGGEVVTLASSKPALAQVPPSVTVLAGQSSASFTATTVAVAASDFSIITATWKGSKKTAKLTVRPIGPVSITFSPTSVRSGKTTTGTVTLEAPAAPGDVTVTLSSNSGLLTVPLSVTIPAGSTSALFTATAGTASVTTSVKVTATRGTVTKTATVKVLANGVATLTLSPTSVKGGTDSQGTIGLDAVATLPTTVTLLPLDSLYARWADAGGNPLNSVVVPAGQQSKAVRIQTFPVTVKKTVTMKATANALSKSAVLTVNP